MNTHSEAGVTVVELMVAIALGLLVILMASGLLVSTRTGYVVQDEDANLQDTGRFAVESIARAIRQAGYGHWDADREPLLTTAEMSPDIVGLDARSLKTTTAALDSPVTRSINGSDVLGLRFFGAGSGTHGDGSMLNCAGFGVAAPASQQEGEEGRGWSIFYVAEDATGEPELYCKYKGNSSWTAQSIARGVESFQVLYGVDLDDDGVADRYVNATTIASLDAALPAEAGGISYWKKIVAIRFALLVRGQKDAKDSNMQYDLFGREYADGHAADDPGVRIREQDLPLKVRKRLRRVFHATVQLRNRDGAIVQPQ